MKPGKYVVFSLGAEQFGLPIDSVVQILTDLPVTRVPKTAKEVLGVISVRGETLPVIDTRAILSTPGAEYGCFLVISIEGIRAAIVADRVDKILDFAESEIEPNSTMLSAQMDTHTGRIGDKLVVLVEPSSLIPYKTVAHLKTALSKTVDQAA